MYPSLEKVKKLKADQSYTKPFRAKVVAKGEKIRYTNKKGVTQDMWMAGLADSSAAIQPTIYSENIQATLQTGKSYMFTNFILRNDMD